MPPRTARAQWRPVPPPPPTSCGSEPSPLAAAAQTRSGKMECAAAVAVVSGVVWIVYFNTLSADFAYDDSRAIKTNQDLLPSTPLVSVFRNDFWGTPLTHSGSHKSYRPLCVLSFRVNFMMGGLDPYGYHLVNVGLHAVVSGLFTWLATALFWPAAGRACVAGLLFAVHPVHTEAVAGVVGRADVGACLFFLLSLLSYMTYCKYRDKESPERLMHLYASLAFAACSMLTKEHGITVLTVCALYDALVQHRLPPRELWAVPVQKRYVGLREGLLHLLGAAFVLVGVRLHLMGSQTPDFAPADNPAADSDSFLTRTLTFLYLPAFNFWLLLCPRWLSFDWSMEAIPLVTSPLDPRNLATGLFYGGLGTACLTIWRHLQARTCVFKMCKRTAAILYNNNHYEQPIEGPALSSGGAVGQPEIVLLSVALLVLPFIPACNLFFYVGFVVAERVLYIPSMGFCLLVAAGLDHLYRTACARGEGGFSPLRRKCLLVVGVALLLAAHAIRTVRRNEDWRDEESLYRAGVPVNPPKAYGNLANILSARGRKAEAEWAYKKALTYRSNMADVHYNLGILLQEQGRHEEALQSYKLAIQFRPRLAMAHLNMGLVLGILGRKEEAVDVYRHCSQLDSAGLKDPKMHETTKISALFNLGRLYADDGKYDEAIHVYREAVRKMPDHYQPQSLYNMMGEAHFKLGQYADAETWYKEALKVKPDHIPAHLTYAKLLSKWNRPSEAEQWFLKARAIAPNDSSIYQHYGQFLAESSRHVEAAEAYMHAAEIDPDEYEIIFNAANTLRQAGKNADAEKYYHMAVKLRPNEVTSHMNLGAMLHVNGKLLEAEMSYLEALRLKPDDPITQNNLQKLRNLLVQRGLRAAHSSQRR